MCSPESPFEGGAAYAAGDVTAERLLVIRGIACSADLNFKVCGIFVVVCGELPQSQKTTLRYELGFSGEGR